jgi:hypothetical protein
LVVLGQHVMVGPAAAISAPDNSSVAAIKAAKPGRN